MTHASPGRKRVVILGASNKPERYAHQAMQLLVRHGHEAIHVHPRLKEIEGTPVVADLAQVTGPVDTVTMYVGPAISSGLVEKLVALKPGRVLFNPGSEKSCPEHSAPSRRHRRGGSLHPRAAAHGAVLSASPGPQSEDSCPCQRQQPLHYPAPFGLKNPCLPLSCLTGSSKKSSAPRTSAQ